MQSVKYYLIIQEKTIEEEYNFEKKIKKILTIKLDRTIKKSQSEKTKHHR